MIFSGVRVLEFGPTLSAQYCAKLFADLGADVTKIEPLDGDWTRQRGPFREDKPDPEGSGLFLYVNTNKHGITLDPTTTRGREVFLDLVRECDILIDGHPPGFVADLGLDFDTLSATNSGLIMAAITPYGQTGPYRNYKAYPLNIFHAGGEAFVLPGGLSYELNPDREPIKAPGYVGDFDGGVAAAIAVVTALFWRGVSGQGQYVDLSVQEVLLHLSGVEIERYVDDGILEHRGTRAPPGGLGLAPTEDGYAMVQPTSDQMWQSLMALMGNPQWAERPEFAERASRWEHGDELREKIHGWTVNQSKDDVYHAGQQVGIATAAVYSPEEVFNSPHEAARGFFVELDHPHVGRLRYPSRPHRFPDAPALDERAAPLLGEHNPEVYGDRLGYSDAEIESLREGGVIT